MKETLTMSEAAYQSIYGFAQDIIVNLKCFDEDPAYARSAIKAGADAIKQELRSCVIVVTSERDPENEKWERADRAHDARIDEEMTG